MSSPRPRCLTVRTNVPVSTLRNPTTVLRAFLPLMMTSACSPTLLHAALEGGNSLELVSSPNRTSPPASSTPPYPTDHFPFLLSWSGSGLPSTYFGRFQRKPSPFSRSEEH